MPERKKWQGYTADDIRKVVRMWNTNTVPEIAQAINRSSASIGYIAIQIRNAGYDLPRKTQPSLNDLIRETLKLK